MHSCGGDAERSRQLARLLEKAQQWRALAALRGHEADTLPEGWRKRLAQAAALELVGDAAGAHAALLQAVHGCSGDVERSRQLAHLLEAAQQWPALAVLRVQTIGDSRFSWNARMDQLARLTLSPAQLRASPVLPVVAREAAARTVLWRIAVDRLGAQGVFDTLAQFVGGLGEVDEGLPATVANYLLQREKWTALHALVAALNINGWDDVKVSLCQMDALESSASYADADAMEAALKGKIAVDPSPNQPSPTDSTLMFRNRPLLDNLVRCVADVVREKGSASIHVAASSTGEEAYSLLIALDRAGLLGACAITASDVEKKLSARARTGVLSAHSGDAVVQANAEMYFTRQRDGRLRFKEEFLSQIKFRVLDLLAPARSAEKWDVVIANNVLVHFPPAGKQAILKNVVAMGTSSAVFCLGGDDHRHIEAALGAYGLAARAGDSGTLHNSWHLQRKAWYKSPRPYWALPPYREATGLRFVTLFAANPAARRTVGPL